MTKFSVWCVELNESSVLIGNVFCLWRECPNARSTRQRLDADPGRCSVMDHDDPVPHVHAPTLLSIPGRSLRPFTS